MPGSGQCSLPAHKSSYMIQKWNWFYAISEITNLRLVRLAIGKPIDLQAQEQAGFKRVSNNNLERSNFSKWNYKLFITWICLDNYQQCLASSLSGVHFGGLLRRSSNRLKQLFESISVAKEVELSQIELLIWKPFKKVFLWTFKTFW